ncbi:MAG: hypothetical protein H7287_05225, partial [Thermoleophilia bacterium]|nr:hypothetical protein [Thermoleophilia bacterium]
MKNVLLKFAGLFIEKVPVDEQGKPLPRTPVPQPNLPGGAQPAAGAAHPQQPMQTFQGPHAGAGAPVGQPGFVQPGQPQQPAQFHPGAQPQHGHQPIIGGAPMVAGQPTQLQPISVALRAWVPQDYAAHLAPFGVHVIAAGGSVTSEQARSWGAQVLVISAECLGQDLHLLQQPQLPTVFIAPQPVMIPDVPGVVQVQEPLRASDVANAARDAAAAF